MTETIDPRDLLVQVAKILDKLKISHIVSGGMAVFVWGRPRFTDDIKNPAVKRGIWCGSFGATSGENTNIPRSQVLCKM